MPASRLELYQTRKILWTSRIPRWRLGTHAAVQSERHGRVLLVAQHELRDRLNAAPVRRHLGEFLSVSATLIDQYMS
jgi:hypothetical protein